MLQRNITGYTLTVQPPDGSHRDPFDLAPDEEIDYPDPIAGCAAIPPGPDPEPAAEPKPAAKPAAKAPSKPAPAADGGETA